MSKKETYMVKFPFLSQTIQSLAMLDLLDRVASTGWKHPH